MSYAPHSTRLTDANLADEYTALHEGAAPDGETRERTPRPPAKTHGHRRMTEIFYEKRVVGERPDYRHPFAAHARPTIALDPRGKLWIYAGRYVVTARGVEDLPAARQTREHLPRGGKRFVELGPLEKICWEQDTPAGRVTGEYVFRGAARPILARDENGDLHALRGQYRIDTEGEDRMSKSKGSRMMNPTEEKGAMMKVVTQGIAGSLIGGVIVYGTDFGLGKAFERVTWNPYLKAGVKGGIGIVAAIALGYASLKVPQIPLTLAMSVGIGGVVAGIAAGVATDTQRRVTVHAGQRAMAPAAGLPAAGLPNQGMPANYQAANAQYCATGR